MENKQNTALKILLLMQTLAVLIYTFLAVKNEGWDLFQIFINNLLALGWNGQFNLDFSSYLLLSGIWIMWRNQFTISSIVMSIVAMILGFVVFAPYLFYLLVIEKGDLKKVLLGNR
ncbi:MAG: hypothetical protein EAZ97_07485 [Bacteroidetes bacterium]|nr:MAG: hypothetical protein EAZ97_07485 [Bacteroidota bacterium]